MLKTIVILFSYSKGYLNDDILSALKEDQLAKKFKTKLPLEIGNSSPVALSPYIMNVSLRLALMKGRDDAAQMLFKETLSSLDFGRADVDEDGVREALAKGYADDSLLSLFRGQQNGDLRLKIFGDAVGRAGTFKDYLWHNRSRVVKATVDGGHCKLLRTLVKDLSIENEVFTEHKGELLTSL